MDCIFCKLINGVIPTEVVYEDERVFAFKDTDPQAPIHYLFVPKEHISSANELNEQNAAVVASIYLAIARVAKRDGFDQAGYRVVANCGEDGGQSVHHMHFHVMAGRKMLWPAG
ncbi:MAG: histidine triad nucleotide-binding protein [Ndongobacter sp.]|nr:histidine triad nucleotide-binding protein [Ndongobacter sp.]